MNKCNRARWFCDGGMLDMKLCSFGCGLMILSKLSLVCKHIKLVMMSGYLWFELYLCALLSLLTLGWDLDFSLVMLTQCYKMNHNKIWSILSWNIRGINSQPKWDHVRNKIFERCVAIVCLQETKRPSFDDSYISKFSPRHLNKFAFSPLHWGFWWPPGSLEGGGVV